jgi:hypothetical protein
MKNIRNLATHISMALAAIFFANIAMAVPFQGQREQRLNHWTFEVITDIQDGWESWTYTLQDTVEEGEFLVTHDETDYYSYEEFANDIALEVIDDNTVALITGFSPSMEIEFIRNFLPDTWTIKGEVCTWNHDMVSCQWESLGLLRTSTSNIYGEEFDLAEALYELETYSPMAVPEPAIIGEIIVIILLIAAMAAHHAATKAYCKKNPDKAACQDDGGPADN